MLRLKDQGPVLILPEALYTYRYNASSTTLSFSPAEVAHATAS